MPVYIGILMLLGIVSKNSILLIDFAGVEIDKGVERTVAIIDAGHKRAQPIVMTTVALVAGMVPVLVVVPMPVMVLEIAVAMHLEGLLVPVAAGPHHHGAFTSHPTGH
jgi:multidrug efflux pump subunit AcrB